MTRAHRVKEIFREAVEMPAPARTAFLEEACGGDADLRAELDSLFDAREDVGDFLAQPTMNGAESVPESTVSEGPGTKIGRYTLLEQIGEGGFGVVFMAEQRRPVDRRVALKIIKLGMDTRQVVARFEAERQALAMMDHPGIARVLDAGATDSGRPYFVMELVRGEPITAYCDRERLPIAQRLALFGQVCQAVQHAHQKGIIHRDLKPSNILVGEVDGRPSPKIIDFGIAKATVGRLTEKTLFTEFRQFMGTPEYMSPEQAGLGGVDIDTRSDIYSLGVLLYELVTGAPPLDAGTLRSSAWEEICRIIRLDEPERPSTRLRAPQTAREIAARRQTEPARLATLVRGDLDWIVMKCLEKDRSRRYETANALAMDVERHLAGEPVVAAPPSKVYRLRKFVSRNRGPVAAGLAIALVLLLGTAGTSIGMVWAMSEAAKAEEEAARRRDVAEFQSNAIASLNGRVMGDGLRSDIVAQLHASLERSGMDASAIAAEEADLERLLEHVNFTDVALHSLRTNFVERWVTRIDEGLAEQPLVQAQLLKTVARTMRQLSMYEEAAELHERAWAIYRDELGEHDRQTIGSAGQTAYVWYEAGRWEEAEAQLQQSVADARREFGDDDRFTLRLITNLGIVLLQGGRFAEAEERFRKVLASKVLSEDRQIVLEAMLSLSCTLNQQGKLVEAEKQFRSTLSACEQFRAPNHTTTLWTCLFLGANLHSQGRLEEAEALLRRAWDELQLKRGQEEMLAIESAYRLAKLLRDLGELDEAEQLAAMAAQNPGDNPSVFLCFGRILTARHKFEDAERELRKARELFEDEDLQRRYPILKTGNRARPVAEAFVELYEAWDAEVPGAGHAEQAAEWRNRLEALEDGPSGTNP